MKHILNSRYIVALGILSVLMFSQCKEDDNTDYSTIDATNPGVTVVWEAPASMEEADVTFPFSITLSEVQIADVVFVISADGSTATEGEDFDLSSHRVRIPAYTTTASGALTVYSDALPEDTETISVQIGDISLGNVNYTPETYNVDITNLVAEDIAIAFDWGGSIDATIGGVAYEGISLCANVDIDFLISQDAPGGDINDYTCATANCPETYALTDGGWTNGDGTFYFNVNLWDNGGVAPDDGPIPFPVRINITQTGVVNISRLQDPSTIIMSDNGGSTLDPILKVVVTNGGTNFSFFDGITDELIFAN